MNTKTKLIIVNAIGLLVSAMGCATDNSTAKDFFPADDEHRRSRAMMAAQANVGAHDDATLHAVHFDGANLNSLGTEKLTRLVPDKADSDVAVNLDLPASDDNAHRREAVLAFLKNCGIDESHIKLTTGPSMDMSHPVAEDMSRIGKTEITADSSAPGSDMTAKTSSK